MITVKLRKSWLPALVTTHRPKLLAVSLALLSLAQAVFLPWPRVLRSIKLWSTDEVLTFSQWLVINNALFTASLTGVFPTVPQILKRNLL